MTESSGLGWQNVVVVDAKLSAPRGEQHTNEQAYRRAYLGDSLFEGEEEQEDNVTEEYGASLEKPLPDTNVGFKLLLKMGWKAGKGLGRNEDGIIEPVRNGVDEGTRLGLGKQEQDDVFTNPENVQRKRLETEIQADEDEERRERREALAEKEAKIREEVTEIKKTFLCETCQKQYNTAMELDAHLSSYDHHHKKRLAEMRAMTADRTRNERMKKEQKQAEREMQRLQKQIEKASSLKAFSSPSSQATHSVPTPPLPPTEPPPLPPEPDSTPGGDGVGGWPTMTSSGVCGTPYQSALAPLLPPQPPYPPLASQPASSTGAGVSLSFGMKVGLQGRGTARGSYGGRGRGMPVPGRHSTATPAAAFSISDSDDEAIEG